MNVLKLILTALSIILWATSPAVTQTLITHDPLEPKVGSPLQSRYMGFKMFIDSYLGEITQDVKYVGEAVRFRVYVPSLPTIRTHVEIMNQLDQRLTFISASHSGQYDATTHTIKWKVGGVRPVPRGSYVEFQAKCTDSGSITNMAVAVIPSFITQGKLRKVQTNKVSVAVYAHPKLGWIPFDRVSEPGSRPMENMKEETTTGVMLNFEIPGMFVRKREVEGVTYHVFSMPRKSNRLEIGKPNLPIIGQLIEVPYGVSFTTEVVEALTISLDYYNVIPAQMPEPEQEYDWKKFVIDKKLYRTDATFPERPAEITTEDIGVIRGHRLVFLKVNPIQYNPATRETTAFRRIEVRINFSSPGQIRGVSKRIQSSEFEKLLEAAVLNWKDPNRFYAPEFMGETEAPEKLPGCDYLIITHNDLYNATDANNPINQLANWKRQKGLLTRVVPVSTISTATDPDDIADDIRDYIQDAYNGWYPVPTYILLVGDVDRVPTNDGTNHPSHRTLPDAAGNRFPTPVGTDLYYATVDPDPSTGSSDYFPDIYVGRISVDTNTDLNNAIDKIIDYETSPPVNPNYYTNTSLVRLFEDDNDPPPAGAPPGWVDACPTDGQEDCTWILVELAEELRDFLQGQGYTAERIYNRSGNWPQGPQRWENGNNLPAELTIAGDPANGIPGFPWTGGVGDIVDAFNDGRFLISYRGHGWNTGWGNPDFNVGNFGALTNANEYPIIFGLTCRSGWFDNETDHADLNTNADCFAEQITRLNQRGAVAIIASARNSWGVANNPSTEGMCDALWPDFDPTIFSGRLPKMGQINTYSKVYMANQLLAGQIREISFEMQNLFGDPEMSTWVEAPGNLAVDHPEGIGASGEQDFVVTVADASSGDNVQSASVTLTRDSSIIATRQTNAGGITRFTIQGPGAGNAEISVTALDYRPYNGTVKIKPGGAVLSRLDPDNGVTGHSVNAGGSNFIGNENVNISLGNNQVQTTQASSGTFGLSGMQDVTFTVPATQPLGPVNVLAHGQTSDLYGVNVFMVRTANPIDLAIYSQWDSSTWTRFPNIDHVTWNNPDIQLYEGTVPIESNNLSVNKTYKIQAKIVNNSSFTAQSAKVIFKWALYGAGQNSQAWTDIDTVTVNVPPGGAYAEITDWKPPSTGHVCLRVHIYHVEDIEDSNNIGQENCHVGIATSPAKVPFVIYNPTENPAMVHFELRQIVDYSKEDEKRPQLLWLTYLKHPNPQMIQPGQRAKAWAIIYPHPKAKTGAEAEFALTAYINRDIIGGINFIIRKQ